MYIYIHIYVCVCTGYTREAEARRINRTFSTEPSKVYGQWQGKKMRLDPHRAETGLYGREKHHITAMLHG